MDQLPPDALTPEDLAIIAEESALHEKVKFAVRDEALVKSPDMEEIKKQLVELRDEAITASERDLPSLFQQMYTHHSLAARDFSKKLPDMRAPYFAHVRLEENGKSRDVLIGYQTFIDTKKGVTIIDWRHAALAKVFFNFREGDDFEMELPGRTAQGVMEIRRVITFDVGELTGISGPDFNLVRARGGEWKRYRGDGVPELTGGAGKAVNVNQFAFGGKNRKLPDVSALLDPEQYEILNREVDGALLILGGAGSGKTTVALHRMALLAYQRPRFYQPRAMKVVVPEQGLVRLMQRLLEGLQLGDVGVETYDDWVVDQGRHILKGLPKRIYQYTPPQVITMKRNPAMFDVVHRYVGMMQERVGEGLRFILSGWKDDLYAAFMQDKTPLVKRLDALEVDLLALVAGDPSLAWRKDTIVNFFKEARPRVLDVDGARSELYTNPELLDLLVAKSEGGITKKMTEELARHTRRQYEDPHGGVDEDDIRAAKSVDGAEVEEDDYAGTMDQEDFTILLYLQLALTGRVARKQKSLTEYKHLVVDEAQDFAPMELRVLGQSLAADATITIAGDAVQQSDPTVVFRGWDDVTHQLDVGVAERASLTTNYRCPRPVAEFGHKVLGVMAPKELPKSIKDGQDVIFSHFPNEGLAVVAISEALSQLFARERLASVAIICENEESALSFYHALKPSTDVRLVIDGEFTFRPGIDVTDVAQIKGLEFDYVIIPDANAAVYPDSPVARRALHIAVTRAVHQLWVCSIGRPSEILA